MKPMPCSRRRRRVTAGFSLFELLITLALIAFLSVSLYGFGSARRQRSQKLLCADNLQKIYLALQIYANDFQGALPQNTNAVTAEAGLDALVPHYTADTAIFICPGGRDAEIPAGEPLRSHKISYAYFMGCRLAPPQNPVMSDRQVNSRPKAAGEWVFSPDGKPPGNNHHKYGGNFLLGDGSVQPSRARLEFPLAVPPGVVLLNPKP
jgi:prepilin-type N-terminal cleavage/methylation domain-containing protein